MSVERVPVAKALSHADTHDGYYSFIRVLLSQLWNPCKAKDIQAYEAIQLTCAYKNIEVQHKNYRERVCKLKFYSVNKSK